MSVINNIFLFDRLTNNSKTRLNSYSSSETSSRLNNELCASELSLSSNSKETTLSVSSSDSLLDHENVENEADDLIETSSDEDDFQDPKEINQDDVNSKKDNNEQKKKKKTSLTRLSKTNGSIERYNYKTRQPHIIFYDFEATNREVVLCVLFNPILFLSSFGLNFVFMNLLIEQCAKSKHK